MKKPVQLLVLLGITGVQTLALYAAAFFYLVEVITGNYKYLPTMLAITVMIFAAAAWASAVFRGLAKTQAWARSSSVFIQTAALAIAYYSFQPPVPRPDIAWALIIPAVIVLALLFTKPLSASFKREV